MRVASFALNLYHIHSLLNKYLSKNPSRVSLVPPNTYIISHGGSDKKKKKKKIKQKEYWICICEKNEYTAINFYLKKHGDFKYFITITGRMKTNMKPSANGLTLCHPTS